MSEHAVAPRIQPSDARDPHRRRGLARVIGVLVDAWMFFTLLALLVALVALVLPAHFLDRRLRLRLCEPIVRAVEWIGDL